MVNLDRLNCIEGFRLVQVCRIWEANLAEKANWPGEALCDSVVWARLLHWALSLKKMLSGPREPWELRNLLT